MMYAHLTNATALERAAGARFTLRINSEFRPIGGDVYRVADKKAARKLAAELNASPWNF